ncbi:hypothetical protein N5T78_07850 [Aliarcobacter cryaerophilus]|uniref:hypothetical protein n=1 Tax=Aliarcobacter cryaerophilus TaxID=28198 RepID=UPI0021B659BB|nr:hypothetical protein [Aliarcobacter cryaerophilus]MCT7466486.1 hypothetical protein [Aliarcobacter cryaerophilus]
MKKLLNIALISVFVLLIQGCGVISKSYVYEQQINKGDNSSEYSISLTPVNASMRAGYSGFILEINNNSKKEIEIDWNKTYFIDKGRTNGTFMFEGIVYKDRNNSKPSDIVFPEGIYSKLIYPNNYVVFNSAGGFSDWGHNGFGTGEFGIYLSLKIDNKEVKEKVIVKVKEQ